MSPTSCWHQPSARTREWLEKNKGISFSQRAVFGRHGVNENTFVVGEALKAKKVVIYLDLSDAFNSVEHEVIFAAPLKKSWVANSHPRRNFIASGPVSFLKFCI